jgi:uncharacterized membrane protein
MDEKKIREVFRVTILLKGVHALFEITTGLFLLFVSQTAIFHFIGLLTQDELTEDPSALIANYLVKAAHHFTTGSQTFAAWYLLSHGLVKAVLVAGILKEKIWMYPVANVIFAFFGIYQIVRFTQTHSVWLLILTALDAVVIILTWHEYKFKKKLLKKGEFL